MPISQAPRARRGSVPVAGWQRQRLGHADRVRIMDRARFLERTTYRRGRGVHGGCLRQSGLRVLWHLLYRGQGRAGAIDPALQQIADDMQMARSTVQLALRRLETAEMLLVIQRGIVRGRRYEQATNAYLLRSPDKWRSDTDLRQALESEFEQKEAEGEVHPAPPPCEAAELAAMAARWGLA